MPAKPKDKTDAKKLAKSVRGTKGRSGMGRARKNPVRTDAGGDTGRTVADERELSPLARLMGALKEEKIEFILIGMSAALVQGVPGSTLDIDYWINLPPRQYMKTINVCRRAGAFPVANTVVELEDDTLVNFVYSVTGLGSFKSEMRKAKQCVFRGMEVPVLSLEQILQSKRAIMRPKDSSHIQVIEETLKGIAHRKNGEKSK